MSSECVSYRVCTRLTKTVLTIIYFLKRRCMQMYDFVCVSACEYEMPVGSVTKHNVAVLIPASRTPLTLLPLSLSLSFLTYPCTIIIFPRYITTCVDEYFVTNHNLADCYNLAQWHCLSPAQKQELWGWITAVACRSTFFPSCRTSCRLDGDVNGGAASPSMDDSSISTVQLQVNESRAAECSFELFSVAPVSMIAE